MGKPWTKFYSVNFSAQETYSQILTFNIYHSMASRGKLWLHYFSIWNRNLACTYLFEGHYPLIQIPKALLLGETAIFGSHCSPSCNLQRMNTCKYPSHSEGTTSRQFYSEQVQGCGRIVLLRAEMVYFRPQPWQLYQVETLD